MANENKILAIDIGGENLKMAEFHFTGDGGIILHSFAFRKMVRDYEESNQELFRRYYNQLLEEGGFTANAVRLSLSAQNSFQRLSKLPPVLGSRDAVDRLIEFEASQTVPYSIDEIEWGYQLLRHEWDDLVAEEQEDGSIQEVSVRREENEALFVAMKSDDVVCYTDVIEDSGKKVLSVDVAPVALFNAAMAAQVADDECALIINIGGTSTSLMIADKQRVFMRNIPTAGESVTAQIAREFDIDREQAEDFKRRYGFVALGGAYEEPESELASMISKITRNVMTRLHGEISRSVSVWRSTHGGSAPTRVLLAGGGSTMRYTTEFFTEKLRIPAEYLNTYQLVSIGPDVDKTQLQAVAPMSQALIGMALRNVGHCPLEISLLPKVIKKQLELNSRKPYLFASAVVLISSLFIFIFGLGKLRDFEDERVRKIEGRFAETKKASDNLSAKYGELKSAAGSLDQSRSMLATRQKWAVMINEIQKAMPENMWLVAVDYDGDNKIKVAENQEIVEEDNTDKVSETNSIRKQMTIDEISNLKDITKVRLIGYTVATPVNSSNSIITKYRDKLKKCELFDSSMIKLNMSNSTNYNISFFELELPLKEAIAK